MSAEDDRNRGLQGCLGKLTNKGVIYLIRLPQIGVKAIGTGGLKSEMGEDNPGVDKGSIAQASQGFKEAIRRYLFPLEAEDGTSLPPLHALIGAQAPLLSQKAHPAGSSGLHLRPNLAANPPRQTNLGILIAQVAYRPLQP